MAKLQLFGSAVQNLTSRARQVTAQAAARKTAQRVQDDIRAKGRVRSGAMVRSVQVYAPSVGGEVTEYRVGSELDYFHYQNDGTGPIFPVRKKVLRFMPKGSHTYVFARRTKGVPKGNFLQDAFRRVRRGDFDAQL